VVGVWSIDSELVFFYIGHIVSDSYHRKCKGENRTTVDYVGLVMYNT